MRLPAFCWQAFRFSGDPLPGLLNLLAIRKWSGFDAADMAMDDCMRTSTPATCPLLGPAASAGFGNHAEPFEDGALNLHEHVVANPDATFFMRVKGDSMQGVGIFDGDLLVVDRSIKARPGQVVVAVVNDEFYVKTLKLDGGERYRLASAHPAYGDVVPAEGDVVSIWGVVRASVRQFASEA